MTSIVSTRTPPILTLLPLPSSTAPLIMTRTPPVLTLLPLPSSTSHTDPTLNMDDTTNDAADSMNTPPSRWHPSQLAPVIVISVVCFVIIVSLIIRLFILIRRYGRSVPRRRRRRISIYDDSRYWTPPPSNDSDHEDPHNTGSTSTKVTAPSPPNFASKLHSHSRSGSTVYEEIQLKAVPTIRHVPASGISASPTWATVSTVHAAGPGVEEKAKMG